MFFKSLIFGICIGLAFYKFNIVDRMLELDILKVFRDRYQNSENNIDIFTLATINLTEAEESDEKFEKVSKELYKAFHDVGFAYVVGCKGFKPDELLHWTRWFFDLPLENKMNIAKNVFNNETVNAYRGYYPVIPGGHSFKEALETGTFEREEFTREYPTREMISNQTRYHNGSKIMRNLLEEKNSWPITEVAEEDYKFREVILENQKIFTGVSRLILELSAYGLGLERNAFDKLFGKRHLSTHRLIHYPTRMHTPEIIPKEAWDGEKAIVTGEHHDSTFVTVLATFENSGLQIKPPSSDHWIDVPAIKDRLIINIGALMSQIVEEKFIATNHRVLDTGIERYSVPFFLEPSYDGDISHTVFGNPNYIAGHFKKYGPWMTNRTSMFAEYATTDFGIDV